MRGKADAQAALIAKLTEIAAFEGRPFVAEGSACKALSLPQIEKDGAWSRLLSRLSKLGVGHAILPNPFDPTSIGTYIFFQLDTRLKNPESIEALITIIDKPETSYASNSITTDPVNLSVDRRKIENEADVLSIAVTFGKTKSASPLQNNLKKTSEYLSDFDELERLALEAAEFDRGCKEIGQMSSWPGDYEDRVWQTRQATKDLLDRLTQNGVPEQRARLLIQNKTPKARFRP